MTLLSRIHHRNLVQFLGFCQEETKSILVYEFMHNGTLKEHLYGKHHLSSVNKLILIMLNMVLYLLGPLTREQSISWIKRLEIAEDAAKGL